jgi:hypothetical protein
VDAGTAVTTARVALGRRSSNRNTPAVDADLIVPAITSTVPRTMSVDADAVAENADAIAITSVAVGWAVIGITLDIHTNSRNA